MFISAVVAVTPSRIFISAAFAVTPSRIFNSSAVEVIPRLDRFTPSVVLIAAASVSSNKFLAAPVRSVVEYLSESVVYNILSAAVVRSDNDCKPRSYA